MSKPVLGLIGAIGAGKSTAAKLLAGFGGYVVDADRVGHDVLDSESVQALLVERWGDRVLDGSRLNRKAIAGIVFENPAERQALEAVVFPAIRARVESMVASARSGDAKFIVLDAATLLEAGWNGMLSKLIYIDAPRAVREARVASRGWPPQELARRERAQWSPEKKQSLCDTVIQNTGSESELRQQLETLLQNWGWI